MTHQQAEIACEKVQGMGWALNGRPIWDKGCWHITFRYRGLPWQALVRDRAITATRDEKAFIEEIKRAVGLAIAMGLQKWRAAPE
jgi:hypothetical protein